MKSETVPVPVHGSFEVDGNTITTTQSGVKAGFLQFSLSSAKNVTWWKGIKVFDNKNNMILLLETTDEDHGPKPSRDFNISDFDDLIKVEIWKAKFLGIHCCMSTVFFKKSECLGKNTLLNWENE